jgi:hypothetical protein
MLWIVGKSVGGPDSWEFSGVFDAEEKAVAACVTAEMFVGPALLNEVLPIDSEGWTGAYYPLVRAEAAACGVR